MLRNEIVRELPTPCSPAQTRTVSLPRETHTRATLTALVVRVAPISLLYSYLHPFVLTSFMCLLLNGNALIGPIDSEK